MGKKPVSKEKIDELAKLSAIGKSCKQISDKVHLHKTTIAKKIKLPEAKKIIEGFQSYYLTYAQDVKRGFMELCLSKDPKIKQKAISEYHSIMGISPTHAPSQFLQQIYIDQRTIAPEAHKDLRELLAIKKEKDLKESEMIDVTPLNNE